jgi:hypothetical protein
MDFLIQEAPAVSGISNVNSTSEHAKQIPSTINSADKADCALAIEVIDELCNGIIQNLLNF